VGPLSEHLHLQEVDPGYFWNIHAFSPLESVEKAFLYTCTAREIFTGRVGFIYELTLCTNLKDETSKNNKINGIRNFEDNTAKTKME
jgi:hypothetical protein